MLPLQNQFAVCQSMLSRKQNQVILDSRLDVQNLLLFCTEKSSSTIRLIQNGLIVIALFCRQDMAQCCFLDMSNLILIPLTLAGYARYLKGIKDDGTAFEPSPDPLLEELQAIVAPLEIGKPDQDWSALKKLYSRKDVFGVDLYEAGLGEQIEGYVKELYAGNGAVRRTLHKYVEQR